VVCLRFVRRSENTKMSEQCINSEERTPFHSCRYLREWPLLLDEAASTRSCDKQVKLAADSLCDAVLASDPHVGPELHNAGGVFRKLTCLGQQAPRGVARCSAVGQMLTQSPRHVIVL
jgi:hypothetical protein